MSATFTPSLKQQFALLCYSFIWFCLVPLALLRLLVFCLIKKPGYSLARLSRFGWLSQQSYTAHGLLIHCASVGEVVAIQTLVEKLLHAQPTLAITITTNTTTGADRVALLFKGAVNHAYLPYDFPLFMKLFLTRLQPKQVLINEMELWPNLCDQCWRQSIPLYVINARMSEKSTRTYRRFPALFQPMFAKITTICAQGERDYQNYLKLGVNKDKLILTNNIKFDLVLSEQDIALANSIKQDFSLFDRHILVAGSTHEPEEQILLDAYLHLVKRYPKLLLILVPRHPQRFDKVKQLLNKHQIPTTLMSTGEAITAQTQVLLCDQMGKLRAIYGLAQISFVGGSIANKGGHNALEPAAYGVPILMGKSRFNNPAICQALADSGALLEANSAFELEQACQTWLDNPELKSQAGHAGKQVLSQNSGAIDKTLSALAI
ncbi:3-deoxy-D-manno-octulosonic acid transferase [Paraglaciecola aestuariivivens]